jgi:hypothetical protein
MNAFGSCCGALLVVPMAVALVGCAVQRAQVAHDAQDKMIGLRKEQVLAQ